MKAAKSFLIYTLYAIGGIIAFWFFGNLMVTMQGTAEEAAIAVVRKYESREGVFSAETIGGSDVSRFLSIRVNNEEIARVKIKNFIGLGWQEETYERV